MQKIITFLTFNHQAGEAARFYTSVFKDAEITGSASSGDGGAGPGEGIVSVSFRIAGQQFVALNGGPSFTFSQGISLFINCETQEEVDELWDKLSDGGKPGRCGWLTDRFGVSWQVVPTALGRLMSSGDGAGTQRVIAAMLQMNKLVIAGLEQAYNGTE